MKTSYRAFTLVVSLCFLLNSCTDSGRTRSLLDDYPVALTTPLKQRIELNKLIFDDHGLKYLEPGIYCATIEYKYGVTLVGTTIIKDGINYGDRTDTIEVEIAKDKFGNSRYLAAFIMNERKDIYSFPESGDSLQVNVNGESIVYHPTGYLVPVDGGTSNGYSMIYVELNKERFFNYQINIFAKGGQCSSKKVPTVEGTLAVNLKHEALQGEAEGRFNEEMAGIARKQTNRADEEDAIQHENLMALNPSQDDIDYANERRQKRYDERRDRLYDLEDQTNNSRTQRSLLKNPAAIATIEPVKAQSKSEVDGLWNKIKNSFSGFFSSTTGKAPIKTIELNSFIQTATFEVLKGEKITVSASGQINFGFFAGSGDPNGIDGFESYSKVSGIRHGSLIGRIANGNWFVVGTLKTFVAPEDGPLQLEINDKDSGNNQGTFKAEISIKSN